MTKPKSDEVAILLTLVGIVALIVLIAGILLATLWPSIKAFFC